MDLWHFMQNLDLWYFVEVTMVDPVKGSRGKAFFVAVFYFTCSISMNFLNKAVVSSYDFNYPFFIMSCQMLATIIFLDISRLLKISKLNTYSLKEGVDFLPASLSFALHSTLSLMALHGMNIPMVMINSPQVLTNNCFIFPVRSNKEMHTSRQPDPVCDDSQQTFPLPSPNLQHSSHHCGRPGGGTGWPPVWWSRLHHGYSLSLCSGDYLESV